MAFEYDLITLGAGSGSFVMAVSSGTLACMRNASSYCWIRV